MASRSAPPCSRRWVLALAGVVVVAGIAARRIPGVVGDVGGGALYTMLLGLLVLLVAPAATAAAVGLVAFGLASAVELLQVMPIPKAVAAVIPVARWVLGGTFAPTDFLAYAAGAGVLVALLGLRMCRRRAQPEPAVRRVRWPRG